ncbi:MAG: aldo/keto reductase [Bryobacteraceae bacterium]|nr:aldo/keto reductase [Bryobacterales bacterium]MEB2364217.1 aldo/keto reductase [Bryobacterales bacterium]NUN02424.1 aldo/keto reductase [Bryobacteraceae bacterium]
MKSSSRRNFLTASLALPAAGLASQQPSAPSGALRYREIGKTGLKVTAVSFGTMITSDASVIERAADMGINYFDTARSYRNGNCERMVGAALKNARKKVYISTKSGARTKEGALEHLETSLKELGTDWVDIWYLHAKSRPSDITDDLMEAQRIAKQQGKVRFAGISTHAGFAELLPAVIRAKHFDVVLTSYNFTMDPEMAPLIESVRKAGIGIVAMKVMAGGFNRIKPGDKLYSTFKKEGAMLAALKWVLRNPNVDTTIPSITDVDQLEENMEAMTVPFSSSDEQVLKAQLDYIRPMYCRMCGRCDGTCSKGIPVADVLRFLAYAEGYGQFSLGRERFIELPLEVRDQRCSSCTSCSVTCPNGVQVAQRLMRAQEMFA